MSTKPKITDEVIKTRESYATGKVIPFDEIPEEEHLKAIKDFSEGSQSLERFLLACYNNGIRTYACCPGHDDIEQAAYVAMVLDENSEKKLAQMADSVFSNKGLKIEYGELHPLLGRSVVIRAPVPQADSVFNGIAESLENPSQTATIMPKIISAYNRNKNECICTVDENSKLFAYAKVPIKDRLESITKKIDRFQEKCYWKSKILFAVVGIALIPYRPISMLSNRRKYTRERAVTGFEDRYIHYSRRIYCRSVVSSPIKREIIIDERDRVSLKGTISRTARTKRAQEKNSMPHTNIEGMDEKTAPSESIR